MTTFSTSREIPATAKQIMVKRLRISSLILLVVLLPIIVFTGFYGKGYFWKPVTRVTTEMAMLIAQRTREWDNTWFNIPVMQFPTDLWTYQSLIDEINPDFIIETGTARGGLTLFLALMLDYQNDHGKVITIDINSEGWEKTLQTGKVKPRLLKRVIFIEGSSTDPQIVNQIAKQVEGKNVLVILDSLHEKEHVLNELKLYSRFVPVNGYILVNDTHLERIYPKSYPTGGAGAAVSEFLKSHKNFVIDASKDKFMVSCFHSGILKRQNNNLF